MALALLRRIAAQPLPCVIDDIDDIVLLRALRAAGMVQASIPHAMRVNGRPFQLPATVHAVTREGQEALLSAAAIESAQRATAARKATSFGSRR